MRHAVTIKPQWTIRHPTGGTLVPRLVDLLVQVHEDGSLLSACQHAGTSYRHAWGLVRQGEALFGAPLLRMERGKGSTLTPLAEKLVWADRRIAARLSPMLDSLASELEVEIEKVLSAVPALLRIQANHGFAVEKLHELLTKAQVPVDLKYVGSQEAVVALHAGECDVSGFPVPIGNYEQPVVEYYRRWLDRREHCVIHVATRRQGLMLAPGNPKRIYSLKDLARPGVRYINRQQGSGTRLLLDLMLAHEAVDRSRITGYTQCEYTHAAVAAYVASGMADAGLGVETPARRFRLEFLPLQTENYFLLCRRPALESPLVQDLLRVLRDPAFSKAVNELPGYDAARAGEVKAVDAELPGLKHRPRAGKRIDKPAHPKT
ncbi:substrate-binding domain-containing protein [Ideonella sp. BN130291]|uniref:substrate-binding domain-containing protein n=1 Tax=Ideonella sp. BN130291 TaxID=3112940 RepID=UPI002E26263D|nr:substrate-binding domain-containing protein [Ideonella sp. BN130291]